MSLKPFSLRDNLIERGYDGPALTAALETALHVVRFVPGVNLRRYNPKQPMDGVTSG